MKSKIETRGRDALLPLISIMAALFAMLLVLCVGYIVLDAVDYKSRVCFKGEVNGINIWKDGLVEVDCTDEYFSLYKQIKMIDSGYYYFHPTERCYINCSERIKIETIE